MNKTKRIAYCLLSNKLHGAEKRVFKLALSSWFSSQKELSPFLFVNLELFNLAQMNTELSILLKNNSSIIKIIPKPIINQRVFIHFWNMFFLTYFKIVYKINILHSYLAAYHYSLILAGLGSKVVFEVTSPDVADTFISAHKNTRIESYLQTRLFKINCVSDSVYNRFTKTQYIFSVLSKALIYMNYPFVSVRALEINSLDDKTRFKNKENVIICACRFIERKNVLKFASVMKDILSNYTDWKIKILGKGPLEIELKKILHEYIENSRAYVGYTNSIIEEFSKSKIVVSLIKPDNYPSQSLFEAMATGNCIVVSNSGNSYRLVDKQNGILSDDFRSDMENLLSSPDKIYNFCVNSYNKFHSDYSENVYFEELSYLYNN
ncbi:glycosyltransferase [Belliella marina]|uniref:Glycosyltransferase n=1 Tax=Belliella marina TaxID=1644146 RepID=A0ABW4VT75_9BACT